MVHTLDSFSSDDSTVCVLKEKDLEKALTNLTRKTLSSPKLSTMALEVKDIEGDVSRPSIKQEQPKLLHSALLRIPMQVRFGLAGTLSNVIFMIMYNSAIPRLDRYIAASTIYALVYFLFIPISHALCCLIVFGWPQEYLKSLLSNFPIGLSAIVIGAAFTAYLDNIRFEVMADDFVRLHITNTPHIETDDIEELGEFYSSLVIMAITGVWTYVISVMVNTPASEPHKKEL